MIEFAQRLSPVTGAAAEWRQGDVFALPVPGTSFDMAFCQQGLQFFPDKLAALKETGESNVHLFCMFQLRNEFPISTCARP